MIYSNILEIVGKTPIVHLNYLSEKLGVNIYAKLESLNPGGSHKIRAAISMIEAAEKSGKLIPNKGQIILEPTGGNTGIGLAIASAIKGYKITLVIPNNYSKIKIKLLEIYGANIILSDSKKGNNSHGELAMELLLRNPNYILLNQQKNPAHPAIHYSKTAQEILDSFKEKPIDYFIGGIGTGAHITGIGKRIKEKNIQTKIIGVEPEGCSLNENKHISHKIQGLSIGIIPDVLDLSIIDEIIKIDFNSCLEMIYYIMSTHGLSIGISSAGNLVAIKKLVTLRKIKNKNFLLLIYDGVESYLDQF